MSRIHHHEASGYVGRRAVQRGLKVFEDILIGSCPPVLLLLLLCHCYVFILQDVFMTDPAKARLGVRRNSIALYYFDCRKLHDVVFKVLCRT